MSMKKFSLYFLVASLLAACGNAQSTVPTDAPTVLAAAKVESELTPIQQHGAKIYKRCRACHTLDEGGRNKVGPNLWGFYGEKTAAKDGFAYSKAMRAADITWDEETLDAYLERPAKYMPGTKMSFIGLKKKEDRDAVQAYLKLKTSP